MRNRPALPKKTKAKKKNDSLERSLREALQYVQGKPVKVITHKRRIKAVDIAQTRKKLGMTQEQFAATFCISLNTLRNWEQGLRKPEGPAKVLIQVIDHNPHSVIDAIG